MYRAHAEGRNRFCSRFRRSKWEEAVPDAAIRDEIDAKASPWRKGAIAPAACPHFFCPYSVGK
jgi:hypothetical protein